MACSTQLELAVGRLAVAVVRRLADPDDRHLSPQRSLATLICHALASLAWSSTRSSPRLGARAAGIRRSRAHRGSRPCAGCSPRPCPGTRIPVDVEGRRCAHEAVGEGGEELVRQDLLVAGQILDPVHRSAPHARGTQLLAPFRRRALGEGPLEDVGDGLLVRLDVLEAGEAGVLEQVGQAQRPGQRRPVVRVDGGDGDPAVGRGVDAVERRGVVTDEAGHALPERRHHPHGQELHPQHRLELRGAHDAAPTGVLALEQARHDRRAEAGPGEHVAHRAGRVVGGLGRRGVVHEPAVGHADRVLARLLASGPSEPRPPPWA